MRLECIKFRNYRQYENLDMFFPETTDSDMHVIVASNGVGKTNMLNAINWCLYNDEPHASGIFTSVEDAVDREKLPVFNENAVQKALDDGNEEFCVAVTIMLKDDDISYEFTRTQRFKTTSRRQVGRDEFTCKKTDTSGNTSFPANEEIAEIIERYLPKGIREYFYFDGEQLLTYFSAQKRDNIKSSVAVIAQINLINKVIDNLDKVLKKEYADKIAKNSPKAKEKEEAYEKAKQAHKDKDDAIKELESEIQKANDAINDADAIIGGQGFIVEKFERLKNQEQLLEQQEGERKKLNSDLIKFLKKYYVLLSLYKVNKDISSYIKQREEAGTLFPSFSRNDIMDSLNSHKCKLCQSTLDETSLKKLESLLLKIDSNVSAQKISSIKNDVVRALNIDNYENEKNACFDALDEKDKQIDSTKDSIEKLNQFISNYGENDILNMKTAIEKRKENIALRDKNLSRKSEYEGQLVLLKDKLDKAYNEYQEAIQADQNHEVLVKYHNFGSAALRIIKSISDELSGKVREDIAAHTTEIFNKLIWKKDTYGEVVLDEDYNIKLYRKRSHQSCLGSCSAAETELLALAFTLAIHKVSGFNSFLFIDTPVGRVSDFNRKNFAEVLLEVSEGKQIILAFTPSEYSNEISSVLGEDNISSYTKLEMDANGITR